MEESNSNKQEDFQDPWSSKEKDQDTREIIAEEIDVFDKALNHDNSFETINSGNDLSSFNNSDVDSLEQTPKALDEQSPIDSLNQTPNFLKDQDAMFGFSSDSSSTKIKQEINLENALTSKGLDSANNKQDKLSTSSFYLNTSIIKRITNTKVVLQFIGLIFTLYLLRVLFVIF